MPREARLLPKQRVDGWPDHAAEEPEVEAMRLLALRLREAMGGRSARVVGEETGVHFTMINDILAGNLWPESLTIIRLELGLGIRLWPDLAD